MKENIKYSPKKMWYIASFIRGMSIDEAIKQLSFNLKKGAGDVKQALLEAQEAAVRQHNVEFKSNLWVGEYFRNVRDVHVFIKFFQPSPSAAKDGS